MKNQAKSLLALGILTALCAPSHSHEVRNYLYRCGLGGMTRICYGASTTVYPTITPSNGKIESCDIKSSADPGATIPFFPVSGAVAYPGLEANSLHLYGPGYVDLNPGRASANRSTLGSCSMRVEAKYIDQTASCVNGSQAGWVHRTTHHIRWTPGAHTWRGPDLEIPLVMNLLWPLAGCKCPAGNLP